MRLSSRPRIWPGFGSIRCGHRGKAGQCRFSCDTRQLPPHAPDSNTTPNLHEFLSSSDPISRFRGRWFQVAQKKPGLKKGEGEGGGGVFFVFGGFAWRGRLTKRRPDNEPGAGQGLCRARPARGELLAADIEPSATFKKKENEKWATKSIGSINS